MFRVIVYLAVLMVYLSVLIVGTTAFAQSPTPITQCGKITTPGDYVVVNNLVLPLPTVYRGEDCLVIGSSHVSIDMQGWKVTASCSNYPPLSCINAAQPIGGSGIHIERRANHVTITNAAVEDFAYGIVSEADRTSVASANLIAMVGISLNGVRQSTFTDISYVGAETGDHVQNGPILSINGGGHDTFSFKNGGTVSESPGIVVTNSRHNVIEGANIDCSGIAEAGPGILLTSGSSHNSILNNNIFTVFGNGIEIEAGSNHNLIQANAVDILSPPGFFAMLDENSNCDHNAWVGNSFSASGGGGGASPTSCID